MRSVTNFLLGSSGPPSGRTERCWSYQPWPSTCPKAQPPPSPGSYRWWILNSTTLFTVLQPSTPLDFSFKQRIANVCIHFLIWTGSPTSPTCGFHMAFMNAWSLFQLVLMLQCFNCHNTVVSTDKSTRYAEKITGKIPVLFTRPNSSTRRICLGSCREKRSVGYGGEK